MIDNNHINKLYNNLSQLVNSKIEHLRPLGVKDFKYRQFLSDGTTIGFSTSDSWNQILESSCLLHAMAAYYCSELSKVVSQDSCYLARRAGNTNSKFLQALNSHGLGNTLAIYKRSHNKIEGFYFISSMEDDLDATNCYLNRLELFGNFISMFQPQINTILANLAYRELYQQALSKAQLEYIFPGNSGSTIRQIRANAINIKYKGRPICLRKREIECLMLVVLGCSTKQIADKLHISSGTAGKYLINLKGKIGAYDKSQIIEFARQTSLDTLVKSY